MAMLIHMASEKPDDSKPSTLEVRQTIERKQTGSVKPWVMITLILGNVALISLCGFGLYRAYILSLKPQVTYMAPSAQQAADPVTSAATSPSPTSDIRTYSSSKMGVTFQYPATWDVTEQEGDITVTSPDVTYHGKSDGEDQPPTLLAGNFIVDIGANAQDFVYGNLTIADSIPLDHVLPGSSYGTRNLSFSGESVSGSDYFETIADTGHLTYKKGSTANLFETLPKVYGKYSIVGGYLRKHANCQSPCRDLVPTAEYSTPDVFAQGVAIMKTIEFPL